MFMTMTKATLGSDWSEVAMKRAPAASLKYLKTKKRSDVTQVRVFMLNSSSVGLFMLHVLFDLLDLHRTDKSVSHWVWMLFHIMCPLHLKPFYVSKLTPRSKMAHCKSSILIFFLLLFYFFFFFLTFNSTRPLLPAPPTLPVWCCHCVWLYCRHWPRPLRRPKSNILTCL